MKQTDRKKVISEILYKIGLQGPGAKVNEDKIALQVAIWDEVIGDIPTEHLNSCYIYASKNFDIYSFKPRHMLEAWQYVKERLSVAPQQGKDVKALSAPASMSFQDARKDTYERCGEILGLRNSPGEPQFSETIQRCIMVRNIVDELKSSGEYPFARAGDVDTPKSCDHIIAVQWYYWQGEGLFCEVCTYLKIKKMKDDIDE